MSRWLPEDKHLWAVVLIALIGLLCGPAALVATQYLDAQRSERLLEQCSHQLTACIAKAPVCR